jgi:predicted O-methyltransferase YrrM
MNVRDIVANSVFAVLHSDFVVRRRYPDFDERTFEILRTVMPYTMTSPERVAALCQAVRHVEANNVQGAFVECGVYRGGSSMAAAMSFTKPRDLYLYDTFEGMSAPTADDWHAGSKQSAADLLSANGKSARVWCYSALDEVRSNMNKTGYPQDRVHYVQGKVEETIPQSAPDQIALLRLDTDWYESTKHELQHLYPRLSPGGIMIVDDYGCWAGARKAVDEYFAGTSVFLNRIDSTGRLVVKPAA